MDKVEETREALMDQWFAPLIEHDGNKFAAAADAYGDACALAAVEELIKKFRPQHMEVVRR